MIHQVGIFIIGIILAIFAILFLVLTITGWLKPRVACFIFTFVFTLFSVGTIRESFKTRYPTRNDVISGKAIYQETQIIQNGDTTRLYDIVWKEE